MKAETGHDLPLVLIAGCPRSGTTWVSRIIKRDPRVAFTYETALASILLEPWWDVIEFPLPHPEPVRTWRDAALDLMETLLVRNRPPWYPTWRKRLIDYFDDRRAFILRHSGLWRRGNGWSKVREQLLDYETFLRLIGEAEQAAPGDREAQAALIARQVYRRFFDAHPGCEVLVDKTPGELFHAEFLLDTFPRAKLIEVVRDGRDVCVSMDAYEEFMPQEREVQVLAWRAFIYKGLELRRQERYRGRILELRFEDLKRDPAGQIERLFRFTGLEISAAEALELAAASDIGKVTQTGEGEHVRKGVVGDWRQRFDDGDLRLFADRAGDAFQAAGYSW